MSDVAIHSPHDVEVVHAGVAQVVASCVTGSGNPGSHSDIHWLPGAGVQYGDEFQ